MATDVGAEVDSTPLAKCLKLERVAECDVFTGVEADRTPWGRVFGGQVMAQALAAAARTVPADQRVHSLHGYFLLAGETGVQIVYEVDRVRDGRSFATRNVHAKQRGKAIFTLTASFHREEWGPEFTTPRREFFSVAKSRGIHTVPMPEELMAQGHEVLQVHRADVHGDTEALTIASGPWWTMQWCRHRTPLSDGLHEPMFAWMSDSTMVATIWEPHSDGGTKPFSMRFSLDHTIHFHRPFRADEWLLCSTRTTVSSGARGLARMEVYWKGDLVATVTQEGLIRAAPAGQSPRAAPGGKPAKL